MTQDLPGDVPAVKTKANIYQIHYREEQVPFLDPDFMPYNNAGDDDPLLEFNVFRKIQRSSKLKKGQLWGALSWKFTEKTGMTGAELFDFIARHPGYDVYYCNPHPNFEGIYHNLWLQGETAHPDFLRLCREVFRHTGLPVSSLTSLQPARAFASTNYIIATPIFWKSYIAFVESVLEITQTRASNKILQLMHSNAADASGVHAGANYLPFIVERLFSVFLMSNEGRTLRPIKYPLPALEAKLNIHQRQLREMKEVACAKRSAWMASCWVNYRNLYLAQQHGKVWLKKYLKPITPHNLEFIDFPSFTFESITE